LTGITCPLIQRASSAAGKTTTGAMSAGSPMRLKGFIAAVFRDRGIEERLDLRRTAEISLYSGGFPSFVYTNPISSLVYPTHL
jgi:hypothetical protein